MAYLRLDQAQFPNGQARMYGEAEMSSIRWLHVTFKNDKFNIMNVRDMIPASGEAAQLLRSLSHPQRLLVLCALGTEERSVAELRELLGIDQVPMSQQLMRLRADELVEARREGTMVYYRITRPEVLTVIEALHSAFCPS
ncbi:MULTISPECIES: ArsR/SmtB family transcription factor [Mesorhizobium]|uniref:ArsR/SmtB family transcription factor n=1 Tax=Mesorhizobium TaxID=68287 RepID=UPI002A24220C|nr:MULTISPECIES: metalloregulator ArsR/SmtB family transcription factor [unclassified Mesorhizobium]MDX8449470.1 metalloregulator ArsR/SmtB family transcription factor [Mesorhizobium sp. VK3C]MDX8463593.1 metalloregulator ArsR/SmtB family transcription factor [Mesorhizobium sp. VK2D]